jgi:hypothetical protein
MKIGIVPSAFFASDSLTLLDLRWRGPSRQSSQRHSGNGNRDRGAGGPGSAQSGSQGGSQGGSNAWGGSGPVQDLHVSVRGFNAAEAKNVLKRGRKGTSHVHTSSMLTNKFSICVVGPEGKSLQCIPHYRKRIGF